MSSIQRFLKQRNLATSIIQAPDNDCYYIFVAAPGNYVGNYPPGYMQLASVNPALIPQGTLLRDMGKTIKAPIGTNPSATAGFFQEVQFIAPQPSSGTFGVGQGSQGAGTLPSAGNAGDAGYGTYYLATAIDGTLATSDGTTTAVLPIVSTVPGAPTITRIEPGDGQTTIYFTPSSDPSSNIIGHQASVNGGPFMLIETPTLFTTFAAATFAAATLPTVIQHTINGVNGVSDHYRVRSFNRIYIGPSSEVVVTHGVPPAPTNVIVTPVGRVLKVTFNPVDSSPVYNNYEYQVAGGDWVVVPDTLFFIRGLTVNTSYPIIIKKYGGIPTAPVYGTPVNGIQVQDIPTIATMDSKGTVRNITIRINPFYSFSPFWGDLYVNFGARVIAASELLILDNGIQIRFTDFANPGDSFTYCYIQLYDIEGHQSNYSTLFYFTLGGTSGIGAPP